MTTTCISGTLTLPLPLVYLYREKQSKLLKLILQLNDDEDIMDYFSNFPPEDLEDIKEMILKDGLSVTAIVLNATQGALDITSRAVGQKETIGEHYIENLALVDEPAQSFIKNIVELFRETDVLAKEWTPEHIGLFFLDLLGYSMVVTPRTSAVKKIRKALFKAVGSKTEYQFLNVLKITGFLIKYQVINDHRGSLTKLIEIFTSKKSLFTPSPRSTMDSLKHAFFRVTNLATLKKDGNREIDAKPQQGFDAEMVDWVIKCCRRFGFNPEFDKNVPKDKNYSSVS